MEKIKQLQQDFADFLANTDLNGQPKELYEPIAYTLLQSGKRLRPMLCLLANELFDGDEQEALWPALALETFHNFTLIHDDIMDKAPLRRGKETVYQKWNADIAILSGDAMLAQAFQYALKPKQGAEIARQLGKVAIEICEGQQMDLNCETLGNVTIPEYLEMIRLKTAVLLAASLKMGAMLGGADTFNQDKLYEFGIQLGLAFQLRDDYLDAFGDPKLFGKKTGGDIACNKKTYLLITALQRAQGDDRSELLDALSLSTPEQREEKIRRVLAVYRKVGVQEATLEAIRKYDDLAMACVYSLDLDDEAKMLLGRIASELAGREH